MKSWAKNLLIVSGIGVGMITFFGLIAHSVNQTVTSEKARVQNCWDRGGTALIVDGDVMCSKKVN